MEDGRKTVYYDPWRRASEIHDFMHGERQDTRSQNIIVHIGIPGGPQSLKIIERHMSSAYLVELGPIFGNSLR
jgi:hypothetical protein